MNKKDLKIIACLRNNARMPLTKMSRKIRVPVSTIFDRLKMSEREVVVKHTCLLDFTKLGYHARANIAFKVDRDDKAALREYLVRHHSVNSVYKINNGYDFMVEGVFQQPMYQALIKGEVEEGEIPCGQDASMVGNVMSAAEVIESIMREVQPVMKRLKSRVVLPVAASPTRERETLQPVS